MESLKQTLNDILSQVTENETSPIAVLTRQLHRFRTGINRYVEEYPSFWEKLFTGRFKLDFVRCLGRLNGIRFRPQSVNLLF
jgi:hypothetical protein